jgi:hypothetical protein
MTCAWIKAEGKSIKAANRMILNKIKSDILLNLSVVICVALLIN